MADKTNSDLHGNAPDTSPLVLLRIDQLLRHALPAARRIAAFKKRCKDVGIPAIYVNDNFGKWRSDLSE